MKKKIILGTIILLIFGGAFYWFQWRPTQIRKECSKYDSEKVIESGRYISIFDRAKKTYEACLREHGLEK